MCRAIAEGRIDFDAVASTDQSPGFIPVANLPRFRRAFEERLKRPASVASDLDAPPIGAAFEGPFLEEEPTPASSANLVVPVFEAPAVPPGLVMVPGLSDDSSDDHDEQASSSGKITGHITDRDTLVGADASDEGHDTFIQRAVPKTAEDVLAQEDENARTAIGRHDATDDFGDPGGAFDRAFGLGAGLGGDDEARALDDTDEHLDEGGEERAEARGAVPRDVPFDDTTDHVDDRGRGASAPFDDDTDHAEDGAHTTFGRGASAPFDDDTDHAEDGAHTTFGRAAHDEATDLRGALRGRVAPTAESMPPSNDAPAATAPTRDESDVDAQTTFGLPTDGEGPVRTVLGAPVTDPATPISDSLLEPPTLRPGDPEASTSVGVRTVAARRAIVEITPTREAGRDLDTLVGGGLPDGIESMTPSGSPVALSDGDIDEVHPTDTQVAVVHPDEDFQPEDLALTSQDDPMPPEHTPPAVDAAPIGHGAMAPMVSSSAPRWLPLTFALVAWAALTGSMFFASLVRGGGAHEATWTPSSAVLWLRIALSGGVGVLLVLALRRRLPLSTQLFRLSWEWAGIAILAGTCVGAMAPFSRPAAPLAIALILAATLAIAEEVFFRGVLGRVLSASPLSNRTGIAIAAILYGLYYGTYFVIGQHDDPLQIALALTMITVGAALPYAILQDLTKGVLASLLCHVSVNVAGVVVRTFF